MVWGFCVYFVYMIPLETDVLRKHRFQKLKKIVCSYIWILCVFCVYDTIGNRCFEKTSFPKTKENCLLLYFFSAVY